LQRGAGQIVDSISRVPLSHLEGQDSHPISTWCVLYLQNLPILAKERTKNAPGFMSEVGK
jgi:hypothetical protein